MYNYLEENELNLYVILYVNEILVLYERMNIKIGFEGEVESNLYMVNVMFFWNDFIVKVIVKYYLNLIFDEFLLMVINVWE